MRSAALLFAFVASALAWGQPPPKGRPRPGRRPPAPRPPTKGLNVEFKNSQELYFDTDGNLLGFYNDHINFLDGSYWFYSDTYECQSPSLLTGFCGVASYQSNDLQNWEHVGFLFDPNTPEIQALCGPCAHLHRFGIGDECLCRAFSGNCGRPHIIYNNATATYVLYVNAGSPGFAVFTSSQPGSGYVYRGRSVLPFQAPPTQVGDLSVEVINGVGYAAYSLIDFTTLGASIWPPFNQSVYLIQLTPDYLNTTGNPSHVVTAHPDLIDYEGESPEIFYRAPYYHVLTSNTCGFCNGTLLIDYRSKSPNGPWTRTIISGDTGGGQLSGVLALPSPQTGQTQYLLYADVTTVVPNELFGARTSAAGKLFRELSFNGDGSIQPIDFQADNGCFTLNIQPGNGPAPTGDAIDATYGVGNFGPFSWQCDIGMANIYQTFVAPKSGTLTNVAFNVGSNGQNGPLDVTIFRFTSYAALISPHYVWETLSTQSFAADTLGVGPNTLGNGNNLIVPGNGATVSQGDLIGIAITNGGTVPYCYIYDPYTLKGSRLFKNGLNQVSLRGPQGTASPVFTYPGSIKFYVNIS